MAMQLQKPVDGAGMKGRVVNALRSLFDPELPVNIYDLGLIYRLQVDETQGRVDIQMTLTAPACPVAQTFPGVVEDEVFSLERVKQVHVEVVWDPPWTQDLMSEAARLELGLF